MTIDTLTLDDYGTVAQTDTFTVFVDSPAGDSVEVWRTASRYTASALANHALDLGYHVETDLWAPDGLRYAPIADAMISPAVWEGYGLASLPSLHRPLLVCLLCRDVRPDAGVVGQGSSFGAPCVWTDCKGTYVDAR